MGTFNENIKTFLIGVATTLSVSAITAVGSMYMDVQILKSTQQQQGDLSKLVQNLDKQVALNSQAVESLNKVVAKLSDSIESRSK